MGAHTGGSRAGDSQRTTQPVASDVLLKGGVGGRTSSGTAQSKRNLEVTQMPPPLLGRAVPDPSYACARSLHGI